MEEINTNQNQIVVAPKRSWKKIVFITILTILAILTILFFFYQNILALVLGQDIEAGDYSDLQIANRVVPQDQNAYFDLNAIETDKIYAPQWVLDYLADKAEWNQSIQSEVYSKNLELLKHYDDAALKPTFQDPHYEKPEALDADYIPGLGRWRQASRISVIKANYYLQQNNLEGAVSEAMKSVIIGHLIEQSQANLITFLVGLAIKNDGLETLEKIKSSLSDEQKSGLSTELRNYQENTKGLIDGYKISFYFWSEDVDNLSKGIFINDYGDYDEEFKNIVKNKFYFKPNLTKSYYAELSRRLISSVDTCPQVEYTPRFIEVSGDSLKLKITENWVGKRLNIVADVSVNSAFFCLLFLPIAGGLLLICLCWWCENSKPTNGRKIFAMSLLS